MTLTDRDKKILVALIPLLALAAFWFLLLSPKREDASAAADELAKQEERLDAARAAASTADSAKSTFKADYSEIVRLGKAIPSSVDMPGLLVQLDSAAAGTGIRFKSISTGERETVAAATPPDSGGSGSTGSSGSNGSTPVAAGGEQAQSAPGSATESANTASQTATERNSAAEQSGVSGADTQTSTSAREGGLPVGGGASTPGGTAPATAPAGLETVPLELQFVGDFFNLADFFHDVKRFVRVANQDVVVGGRLVTIESVRWTSEPEFFPRLKVEIGATVYLSPKAQGATAGATPEGPAPGGSTTTTPADATPPSATPPTATATP